MNIPSFILSQDLAGLLITLAGQSIIVSFIGIASINLLSGQSAPVRSFVSAAAIAALGLLMVISIGLRWSDIWKDRTHPPILLEEYTSDQIASSEPGKALPFASVHLPPRIQSQYSNETDMFPSIASLSPLSIQLTPAGSFILNISAFIWLAGIMFLLVRFGHSVVLSKKFRNNLQSVRDTAFNSMVRTVAGTFWNKRLPGLYSSPLIESPIAIGFFNPIVVIPEKLLATLSENELKSILLHELSHIFHYDQVISVIKRVVLAFYWWNPFVYALNRHHEQAREEVSDNYVLRELHPKVYTRCLMDLAEKVCLISSCPTTVGMAGRGFDLRVRVERLLSKKRRVAMNTKLYLKAIILSTSLILTFMIAGLYASVKVESIDDAGKELQETRHAINPTPIFGGEQHLSQKNATEPEAIEEKTPDNSQKIVKTETATPTEFLNKKARKSRSPIGILAPVGTNAKEIIEKQDETEEKIILSQKETIENNAQAADASISRGVPNLEKGPNDDAISDLNKSIELNPQDASTYFSRGNAYCKNEQYDRAVVDYSKAIELDPGYIEAYVRRGNIYDDVKHLYKEAIADYSKAIELNPEDAVNYYLRGNVYLGIGYFNHAGYPIQVRHINYREERKALSDYNMAIKLNPKYDDAYVRKSYILFHRGEFRKAIKINAKALDLNPDNALAKRLHIIYSEDRDYAEWGYSFGS